jgi:DNA-binding transcriptional ArsR family regulator
LPISRQAVSKHLSTLAGAGLVDFEVRGREKRYRLTPQPFGEAMSWMADVGSEWDGRLEALKALLSRPPP